MSHVLIVDDEPSICWAFRELLTEDGHEVSIAASAEKALELACARRPDAVVLDVRLPGNDGLWALQQLREHVGDMPVIVMTAFGNLETAVRSVASGAYDYLPKPFDLDQAAEVLRRALTPPPIAEPSGPTRESSAEKPRLVGTSAAMQAVFKQIALVAGTDAPVLITGESGTGKELVAEAIHQNSLRRSGKFVPVCLAELSSHVIESELFGHVKGAFTGAETDRTGLLESAHRGTAFLDEIGDVPLLQQVKLLRAVERREVIPVGGSSPRAAEFRVIAATNRVLPELIAEGKFREDLFYRFGVFHIELPPLRERTGDIPLLAEHFLEQFAGERLPLRFTEAAMAALCARRWEGNVRELRNVVEHGAIVARGDFIDVEHLPPARQWQRSPAGAESTLRRAAADWIARRLTEVGDEAQEANGSGLYEEFLSAAEPALLQSVLHECGQNRALAARRLGIHRTTLRQKLNKYGLN